MKRFACIALIAALCCGLLIPMAAAEQTKYSSTQQFLDYLDGINFKYTYLGRSDDGDDRVSVGMQDDDFTYRLNYFFQDNQTLTSIRVWNIITYDKANESAVMDLCDRLNDNYRYATFYADSSDNTVTVRAEVLYRSQGVGEAVWDVSSHLMDIIELAYAEQLSQYDISISGSGGASGNDSSASSGASGSSDSSSGIALDPLTELSDRQTVLMVQQILNVLGYNCGTPDGVLGKNTRGAIQQFQRDRGLTVTGTITYETYSVLQGLIQSIS